jgi:hypothetical protein
MNSRLIIFASYLLFAVACGNTGSPGNSGNSSASGSDLAGKTTTIQWIDSAKNYGKINEGQKLSVAFRFKNNGKNPLVIESVRPGCGCTVADFPKEPIAPGMESEITGIFDSHGREGLQHKEITVRANTPGTGEQNIFFDVDVVKKPGAPDTEQ